MVNHILTNIAVYRSFFFLVEMSEKDEADLSVKR